MSKTPTAYLCPQCVKRYSTDGICSDCNISLTAIYTIQCKDCESELKADAKHCSHCGASIQNTCSNCGTILDGDDMFCPDCGNRNDNSVEKPAEAKQRSTKSQKITGKDMVDLLMNPVGLSKFLSSYPYLATGPNSEEYETAIEKGSNAAKKHGVELLMQTRPRQWALLKPGMIRRIMTILFDVFIWGAFFAGMLTVIIGSHKGGGILRAIGLGSAPMRSGAAFIWFGISLFGYTALAESVLGSTIGGFLCGTRVVNEYGNKLTVSQAFFRQFTKLLYPLNFIFGPGTDDYEVVLK